MHTLNVQRGDANQRLQRGQLFLDPLLKQLLKNRNVKQMKNHGED